MGVCLFPCICTVWARKKKYHECKCKIPTYIDGLEGDELRIKMQSYQRACYITYFMIKAVKVEGCLGLINNKRCESLSVN